MYNELYEAWKKEKENAELQSLPKDFYARVAEYLRKMREESRMLDEKTTKARLLIHESENVRKMVKELVLLRQEKTLTSLLGGEMAQAEDLTLQEEELLKKVAPSFESFQSLSKEIANGRLPLEASGQRPKKRILRFLKEIPAIVGSDMKTYGPFKPEDVASVPVENAKILIKQGIAAEVEAKLE